MALAGAEVAADRSLAPDLVVGDVERALRERLDVVGELGEPRDRQRGADRDGRPVHGQRVEARSGERDDLRRRQPPVGELGHDDRPAPEHRDVASVSELRDRVLGRGRKQDLSGLRHGPSFGRWSAMPSLTAPLREESIIG